MREQTPIFGHCAFGQHEWASTSLKSQACRCGEITVMRSTELEALRTEQTRLREALQSIANSSCCGCCQEAAKFARAALSSTPTPEHK